MSASVAAACAGLAFGAAVWLAGYRPAAARLGRLRARPGGGPSVARRAGPVLLGVLVVVVLASRGGGMLVVALPAVVAVALRIGRSRAGARAGQRDADLAVPRVADLVASCVAVGVPPAEALDVVRRAVGGAAELRLAPVVSALRLGGDPVEAYLQVVPSARRSRRDGSADPMLSLVQALARAAARGTPLAEAAGRVADESRGRRRWLAEAAARRAGVVAVGPLMVCHLPAFVLIGVVPLVLGVARSALGDLG